MTPKPGWQTSEFWLTIFTVIGTLLTALLSTGAAERVATYANSAAGWTATISVVAAAVSTGLYALARSLVKKND